MFMRGKKKPLKMLIEDDDGPTFIEYSRGMSRGHDIQSDVVENMFATFMACRTPLKSMLQGKTNYRTWHTVVRRSKNGKTSRK